MTHCDNDWVSTGVSPVGAIRDRRIPNTLPSCGSRRELPFAPFFLQKQKIQSRPREAIDTGSARPITR
jgi:hypothetical protein